MSWLWIFLPLGLIGYMGWSAYKAWQKNPEQFWTQAVAIVFLLMALNLLGALAFQIDHWDHFSNWVEDEDGEHGGAFTLATAYFGAMWLIWHFGKSFVKEKE